LENARTETARVLGARPEEIIFTSGGTESNNLAIQGIVWAWHEKTKAHLLPHVITTNIEHSSVLEACKLLEKRKLAEISIVPVEANGIVDPKKIKKEIKENTLLVSVMYANNEIGTLQPIGEIAREIRHYKKINKRDDVFFHTDAVQAVNYLSLNIEKLGVDMLTLSGSKIEGSGRVGVLYKGKNVPLVNIFGGGDQEGGLRPGTENLQEIIKFSKAFSQVQKMKEKEAKRLAGLRNYFFARLSKLPFGTVLAVNGDLQKRLPNNVNVTFPNIPSDLLVIELSAKGIMASSKSACKSGDGKASHVIKAIRPNMRETDGAVRFSLGTGTTKKDIDYTVQAVSRILNKLKKWYS
jgi:cysteine desulfurase